MYLYTRKEYLFLRAWVQSYKPGRDAFRQMDLAVPTEI